jgi:hypothetical protein
VQIKSRNEILTDIIKDSKKHPKGWMATFGKDRNLLSNDCYIFNPNIGIYLIKEYYKNPYQVKGVGSKIARNIDEDIERTIRKDSGDFGVVQGDIQKIIRNVDKGIHPQKIFEEGLKGNDLGIKVPVKGKASTSQEAFSYLNTSFSTKQKKLDSKFEKIMNDDGVYDSYD